MQRAMQRAEADDGEAALALFSSYVCLSQVELAAAVYASTPADLQKRMNACLHELARYARPALLAPSLTTPSASHLAWFAASLLGLDACEFVPAWNLAASELVIDLGLKLPLISASADEEARLLLETLSSSEPVMLAMLTRAPLGAALARFVWARMRGLATWADVTRLAVTVLVARDCVFDAAALFALADASLEPPPSLLAAAYANPEAVSRGLMTAADPGRALANVFGRMDPFRVNPWSAPPVLFAVARALGLRVVEDVLLASPCVLVDSPFPRALRIRRLLALGFDAKDDVVALARCAPLADVSGHDDALECELADWAVRVMFACGVLRVERVDVAPSLATLFARAEAALDIAQLRAAAGLDVNLARQSPAMRKDVARVRQRATLALLARRELGAFKAALEALPDGAFESTARRAVAHALPAMAADAKTAAACVDAVEACVRGGGGGHGLQGVLVEARLRLRAARELYLDTGVALACDAAVLVGAAMELGRVDLALELGGVGEGAPLLRADVAIVQGKPVPASAPGADAAGEAALRIAGAVLGCDGVSAKEGGLGDLAAMAARFERHMDAFEAAVGARAVDPAEGIERALASAPAQAWPPLMGMARAFGLDPKHMCGDDAEKMRVAEMLAPMAGVPPGFFSSVISAHDPGAELSPEFARLAARPRIVAPNASDDDDCVRRRAFAPVTWTKTTLAAHLSTLQRPVRSKPRSAAAERAYAAAIEASGVKPLSAVLDAPLAVRPARLCLDFVQDFRADMAVDVVAQAARALAGEMLAGPDVGVDAALAAVELAVHCGSTHAWARATCEEALRWMEAPSQRATYARQIAKLQRVCKLHVR